MTTDSTGNHGKGVDVDVRELFNLLDSPIISDVTEIKELVQEKLDSTKETWILSSLVDYYYITSSKEAIDVLVNVKEPHDKHLVDKLGEGIRIPAHRLKAVQLLLHVVCKQPMWIHRIISQSVFSVLIKCLKTETDVPILMTGVMALTILLPSVPTHLGTQHLNIIFDAFSHLVAFTYKKPGNVPEVFMLHLQVALYSLFHRLYGMFPYNFLTYLRHYYCKKDNIVVYEECVKPMLERVRLHPHLITGDRNLETSAQRWKNMESQDVIIECAKMSLDIMEGMWDESTEMIKKNVLYKPLDQQPNKEPQKTNKENSALRVPEPIPFTSYQTDPFFSPSLAIGMSTPPPSQRTTPATSIIETYNSAFVQSGTYGNTPVLTPRTTPPILDETEKGMSRNSSRGSLFTNKGSDKRLSTSIVIPANKSQPGSETKTTVPPSPMKPEFTSEPPVGMFKSQPVRTTARELKFDIIKDPVLESPAPSFTDHLMMYPHETTKEVMDDGIDHMYNGAKDSDNGHLDIKNNLERPDLYMGTKESDNVDLRRKNSIDRPDLMDSFSMETLPKMMENLHHASDEDSAQDDEVSDITQCRPNSVVHLTAESVAQFMKSVNRIRFNSLTATNSMEVYKQERFKSSRSRSCPSLPKLASVENEDSEDDSDSDQLSRSVSMASNFKQQMSEPDTDNHPAALPVVTTVTTEISTVVTTTSSISITSCPIFSPHDSQPNVQSQNSFMDIMKNSLLPNSVHLCQKCKAYMVSDKNQDTDVPIFQSLSPLELLDKHLTMGREIHAKELSKIPITSLDAINWTHFGGAPPADEINILRGQIIMMENQLMYERNKRELHNKRNRRLLRKIANAETLQENNNVLAEQIHILETEIQNLQVSTKLLQNENRTLKNTQESNEHEMRVKLRICQQENSDLKSTKAELNTLLVRQREEQDALKKKLQEAENKLFHRQQEIVYLKEQEEIAQKLKDQMLQTHKELMLMGELQQKYQENININKYRNNKQPEHDMVVATLKAEIKVIQAQWERDSIQLTACQQKILEMEEIIKNKDVCVKELKAKLEEVKVSQEDEIKAVEDKYQSLVKITQGLEGKLLELYSQMDELTYPKQRQGCDNAVAASFLPISQSLPEEFTERSRTESDPVVMETVSKPILCKTPSVPPHCTLNPLTESHSDIGDDSFRDLDGASVVSKESGIET